MSRKPSGDPGWEKAPLLFGISLFGLVAVLLLDFGVIYTLALDPSQSSGLMKMAYTLTVAGLLIATFQGILVYRGILDRLGKDRRLAEEMAERIGKLTVIDSQTKAFNRKKFDTVIVRELENTRRYGNLLCGILFDIDNFKEVNEHYGYGTGDRLLMNLSRFVGSRIRNTDYLFRWRGGKFLILIPHLDVDKAAIVAEKLRKAVESTEFVEDIATTISLAAAQARAEDTPELFIQRLQNALAGAKSKGRNRTEVARTGQ